MSPKCGFRLLAAALLGVLAGTSAAFALDLFAEPEFHPVGDLPIGLAAGDLDGNLLPELVVANRGSADLSIVWNAGGPSPVETRVVVGGVPRRVAVGDLNGDDQPDLAVGRESSPTPLVLLMNRGNGTFDPPVALGSHSLFPDALWIGDLDQDSDRDLVFASAPSNMIVVFLNDGSGQFTETVYPTDTSPSYPSDLAVGDADDDGDLDLLVTASLSTHPPVLFLNLGNGTFAPYVTFTGVTVDFISAAVGDLALDGAADLTLLNFSASVLAVFPHEGGGSYGTPTHFPIGATTQPGGSVRLADLDLDGRLDAAIGLALQNPAIPVLLGNESGGFGAPTSYATGAGGIAALTLVDLDSDGDRDIAATSANQDVLVCLENLAEGSTAVPPPGEANGFFFAPPQPNPGRTPAITFHLPRPAYVRLSVHNVAGRTIARLLEDYRPAGRNEVEWRGTLPEGGQAPAGVYYLRLETDGFEGQQRVVLTR